MEQIGSSVLSKIKSRIKFNLATLLKTGLFHGRMGGGGVEEERHFCLKTKLRTVLEITFFCVTFWLYSSPSKCENHFLHIFSKILQGGDFEGIFVL